MVIDSLPSRPVRVVIDGMGRQVSGLAPTTLRVDYGGAVILVHTESDGVTVEDREPDRTWTDGDALLLGSEVWVRKGGRWRVLGRGGSASDAAVSDDLSDADVPTSVLRYQAGEDQ
jgi:hypothetical protein